MQFRKIKLLKTSILILDYVFFCLDNKKLIALANKISIQVGDKSNVMK
jgi:hypothetical protein